MKLHSSLAGASQKFDLPSRLDEREADRKATEKARRDAYKAVEVRDQMTCRVCGRKVRKIATLHPDRLEHHHIDGRDVIDAESTKNICCVCKFCHDLRHLKRTLKIEGNANKTLICEYAGRIWYSTPGEQIERHLRSWQRD